MEFVSGGMKFIKEEGELFFHLRRARKFSESITKFYAAELVIALKYLHEMGVIYRLIKIKIFQEILNLRIFLLILQVTLR